MENGEVVAALRQIHDDMRELIEVSKGNMERALQTQKRALRGQRRFGLVIVAVFLALAVSLPWIYRLLHAF